MPNTLTDYGYLSTDGLVKGVAITIVKRAPIFQLLPFMEIVGNSLKYNLESAEAGIQFYQPDAVWSQGDPTWAQRSVSLYILGGDVDIDNFASITRSNINDIVAEKLALKSKAAANFFNQELIIGGTTAAPAPDGFKGIYRMAAECESTSTTDLDAINNDQVIAGHATSQTLTLANIDEVIDALDEPPDFMMMSKRHRRKLTALARAAGASLTYSTPDARIGTQVEVYNGVNLLINDHMKDNLPDNSTSVCAIASYSTATSRAAANDNSFVVVGKLGQDALCGVQNGGLQVIPIGQLEGKDASRWRIRWYCGAGLFNTTKIAVLTGTTDGT